MGAPFCVRMGKEREEDAMRSPERVCELVEGRAAKSSLGHRQQDLLFP